MSPDITMCSNDKCRLAGECYRYQAIPDKMWQSYSSFDADTDFRHCLNFVEIMVNDKLVTKESK